MQWCGKLICLTETIVDDACLVLGKGIVGAYGVRHVVSLCGLTLKVSERPSRPLQRPVKAQRTATAYACAAN